MKQKFKLDLNLPNTITLIRIAMIPLIMLVLLLPTPGKYLIAAILFVAAAATDGLDGYFARSRNLVTSLGKFLDPLADKLLILATLICLLALEDVGAVVIIIILTRELMVTGLRAIAADKGIVIAASYFGKLKTVSQIVAITYVLLAGQFAVFPDWLGTALIWIAAVITILSGADYFYKSKELFS
ncbi:MAG TPA: CDP-diacylglycerol--glycerol-3-phosphate 3-phosphatidyltransferase [Clostridiales bacterium]|nr:CDP-diacylglycerol--glycerol-3-phosphate 3-phosphatidyltransferase [Clostridiales bacterium]